MSVTTNRPSRMIATRSATRCTSSRECEESNTVRPAAAVSRSNASNSACTSGSRPAVGSSRISSFRPVHERQEQPDLLAVALRELAHRTVHVDREPLDERVGERLVVAASSPAEPLRRAARPSCGRRGGGHPRGSRRDAGSRRCRVRCRDRAPRRFRSSPAGSRAAFGSSSTSRRRWARESRRPRRARPAGRALRSLGAAVALGEPMRLDRGVHGALRERP